MSRMACHAPPKPPTSDVIGDDHADGDGERDEEAQQSPPAGPQRHRLVGGRPCCGLVRCGRRAGPIQARADSHRHSKVPVVRAGQPCTPEARPPAWAFAPGQGYGRAVPTIETATGPVDSASLGRVLMHEHVFVISPEMKDNVPEEWGDEDAPHGRRRPAPAGAEGRAASTPSSTRRRSASAATSRASAQLAPRIDLKIIVATGLYTFNELPHYWSARVPGQRARRQRPHGEPVRAGHHRGHRRHGHQGRRHQVRHRPPRHHPRRRARAAGVRADAPGHRRADHDPHRRRRRAAASSSRRSSSPRAST